ncbi:hypothetical protein SDC9_169785 [bioreactor metagenome]|uniref:Uncharacterized protein n=1 Tax=bioreactor metagenome TaxID=1076179 RepID=A0A645G8V2_9ZZZZ
MDHSPLIFLLFTQTLAPALSALMRGAGTASVDIAIDGRFSILMNSLLAIGGERSGLSAFLSILFSEQQQPGSTAGDLNSVMVTPLSLIYVDLFDYAVFFIEIDGAAAGFRCCQLGQHVDEDVVIFRRNFPPAQTVKVSKGVAILIIGPKTDHPLIALPAGIGNTVYSVV